MIQQLTDTKTDLDVLTKTSACTFCQCEKKYCYRYERCIKPKREEEGEQLQIGNLGHAALEAARKESLGSAMAVIERWRESQPALGDEVQKVAGRAAKTRACVIAAVEKWPAQSDSLVSEHVVEMPIVNPQSKRGSRTFRFRGKVDEIDGGVLADWKFTGDAMRTIKGLTVGFQAELYAAAAAHLGFDLNSVEYRLITTPTISLCGKDNHDPAQYEKRCLEWIRADGNRLLPHEVYLNPARIGQALKWLWNVTQKILLNRRSDCWLTNERACFDWSRACEYLSLCECEAQGGDVEWLIGERFEATVPHPELEPAKD